MCDKDVIKKTKITIDEIISLGDYQDAYRFNVLIKGVPSFDTHKLNVGIDSVSIPTRFSNKFEVVFFEFEDLFIKRFIKIIDDPEFKFNIQIQDLSKKGEVLIKYDLKDVRYNSHTTNKRESSNNTVVKYSVIFEYGLLTEELKDGVK